MTFQKNTPYTRSDIQRAVGGELQTYLPQKQHRILAGCFSSELNPLAPNEIYAGKKPKVVAKAELLADQPENRFPVFVRRNNDYFFEGYFAFQSLSNAPLDIQIAEKMSNRIDQLSYVIRLKALP